MDKKSFIRGFGVGVLFTAMILGISCLIRTSDSAVVRRAKALGMEYGTGEESLFRETGAASRGAASEDREAQKTQKPVKNTATPAPTKKKVSGKKSNKEDDETKAIEREIQKMEQQAGAASRQITISAGDWSSDVSRRLEAMDIISDANDFDSYLEKSGYSGKIKAGTYTIPPNATYEQIARAITGG